MTTQTLPQPALTAPVVEEMLTYERSYDHASGVELRWYRDASAREVGWTEDGPAHRRACVEAVDAGGDVAGHLTIRWVCPERLAAAGIRPSAWAAGFTHPVADRELWVHIHSTQVIPTLGQRVHLALRGAMLTEGRLRRDLDVLDRAVAEDVDAELANLQVPSVHHVDVESAWLERGIAVAMLRTAARNLARGGSVLAATDVPPMGWQGLRKYGELRRVDTPETPTDTIVGAIREVVDLAE